MQRVLKAFLVVSCAVLFASCGNEEGQQSVQEQEKAEKVRTAAVAKHRIMRTLPLSGTLEGYESMSVAPSMTGIIEHIYVEEGDRVKKGDKLVRLDQTQARTTRQSFKNYEVEMKRMDALKEAGSISQQTYDQTKLAYDQAKENLKYYEQQTYVDAQFDGVISAKNFEDGELYGGGSAILSLVQINKLKIYVNVPEQYFPRVKEGMKLEIESEIYPGKTFVGTVEVIFPTIDATTHTFRVKVAIPNASEELRPGMYVKTYLDLGEEDIMTIPYQSVLKLIGSNDRYVFIDGGGVAKRVPVVMGERYDENVEILPGELKEGDMLVVVGQGRLVDGVKLEVMNDEAEAAQAQ